MAKNIVVIGGVAAGPKAAARARRLDPDARITIIERGEHLSYAGCGMPFYVGGEVEEARDLMTNSLGVMRDATFFKAVKGIDIRTRTLAEAIDREKKEVSIIDVDSGERSKLPYDQLVLATGSEPVVPPIPGIDLNRVFRLASPTDAVAVRTTAKRDDVRRAVIIGGGLIGLEIVSAFVGLGLEVTVIEALDEVLPSMLDPDMGIFLRNHMRRKGVEVRTGERVLALEGDADGNVARVITAAGEIATDMVLVAIGVRPNVRLAQEAGLEIGPTRAISVNEYLQTSDPSIYAGGDCAENTDIITGRKVYAPMGSIANRHGRVIGSNLAGVKETFAGTVGTVALGVLGFNIGRTGLSERQARDLGYEVITALAPAGDRAHFHPNSKSITIKLIADSATGRVLGAQAMGAGDAVKRIDVVATAVTLGATVDQLAQLDLAYAPPYASAIDPLHHVANVLRNKRDGVARDLSAEALRDKLSGDEDFILLDVRTPREFETARIQDRRVKLIPLDQIRQRLGELPSDIEIVTLCRAGVRAYEAQTTLLGAGFEDVKFLDGGMIGWPYETATSQLPQK